MRVDQPALAIIRFELEVSRRLDAAGREDASDLDLNERQQCVVGTFDKGVLDSE